MDKQGLSGWSSRKYQSHDDNTPWPPIGQVVRQVQDERAASGLDDNTPWPPISQVVRQVQEELAASGLKDKMPWPPISQVVRQVQEEMAASELKDNAPCPQRCPRFARCEVKGKWRKWCYLVPIGPGGSGGYACMPGALACLNRRGRSRRGEPLPVRTDPSSQQVPAVSKVPPQWAMTRASFPESFERLD